jgi:hypothetical protein
MSKDFDTDHTIQNAVFSTENNNPNEYASSKLGNIQMSNGIDLDGYKIVRVLDDVILAVPDEEEGKSDVDENGYYTDPESGLSYPVGVTDNGTYQRVRVLMVGPDVTQVSAGDLIVITRLTGTKEIDYMGTKLLHTQQSNIWYVLSKNESNPANS